MIRAISVSLFVSLSLGMAKIIPVSLEQFRSPDFIKAFTGSYGILSPVEPKVTAKENELLNEVAEDFGNGKFNSAESKLVNFIKERKDPTDGSEPTEVSPALIFVLGNLYFQNDRPEDAIRSYKLAIKRFPKFRRAFKNLALLYASNDDLDNALPYLKQTVQLGDSDHRTFGLLGYCYLSSEKPLASEGAYRQAYLLNPDEKDWKLGLAQALLLQEKWTAAAALLGELIEESPDNKELWIQQANCYLGKEDTTKAANNFEVLRLKGLADSDTLSLLGNIYMDNEQPGLALNAYAEALAKQTKPNIENALKTAKILVDFGAYDQAEIYLNKVSSYSLNTSQKVQELLSRKKIAEARQLSGEVYKILNTASELQPGNGEVMVALGRYYSDQAKLAEEPEEKDELLFKASAKLQQALNKEAVRYDANLRLGQVKVSQKLYEDALVYLDKALSLKNSDNLKQYVRRVQRAAEREAQKKAEEDKKVAAEEGRRKAEEAAKLSKEEN